MTVPNIGPTVNEENQNDSPITNYPPVSVTIDYPVNVRELPSVVSAIRKVICPADNTSVNVANQDSRRRSIKILSTDTPFLLGTTKNDVDGGFAPKYPINVMVTIEGSSILYAKTGTADSAATLSVIELDWTE